MYDLVKDMSKDDDTSVKFKEKDFTILTAKVVIVSCKIDLGAIAATRLLMFYYYLWTKPGFYFMYR